MARLLRPLVAAVVAATALAAAPAAARERADIPPQYRWNLADLFPSDAAWRAARDDLAKRIPGLAAHRGKLGQSAGALRLALDDVFGARLALERLFVYASARGDEDTRLAPPREMRQSAQQLAVDLESALSWLRPELLTLDPARVRGFLGEEQGLAPYAFFLDDVLRWKPHTLGAGEERVAAEAASFATAGDDIAGVLRDADLPWPSVKLSTGEEVRLDPSGYSLHRASPERADRDRVFDAFFGALSAYQRTLGASLYATVKAHLFEKNARGLRLGARGGALPRRHPARGLHAAPRRRAPQPADAPPLPRAAQAHARPREAPLPGPLRPHRAGGARCASSRRRRGRSPSPPWRRSAPSTCRG